MSFSSKVKDNLCHVDESSDCCRKAEFFAFFMINGSIRICGQHQLSVPAHGVDILFFKENVYTVLFQHSYRFQHRDRVPCKASGGFGNDHIDLTGPAIRE